MTKREFIATQVLCGIMANPNIISVNKAVEVSVQFADKLLEKLNEDWRRKNLP